MATTSDGTPRHGAHFSGDDNGKRDKRKTARRSSHLKTSSKPQTQKATAYLASPRVSAQTAAATQRAASNVGQHDYLVGPIKRERRFLGIIAAVFIVGGLVAGGLYGWYRLGFPMPDDTAIETGQEVIVTIPDGAGGAQIAQLLVEKGVLATTSDFLKEVQSQDAGSSMKSGTYRFVTGGNTKEVVHQLVLGPNSAEHQFTIIEGLTVAKTAAVVEGALGISADSFIAQAKASFYVNDYPFLAEATNDSLEGFLYPKTYDLGGKEATADAVIRLMLDQYQTEVASLDLAGAEADLHDAYGVTLTNYDLIKVASIIEREAVTEEDRPLVSSVIYNRLRDGMNLQSDATMGYVTGGEVTAADLQVESPYNTYLHNGLTPTPICNPSLAAINAAMRPASTDYFYFLIIENNDYSNHSFSETYEQHQQAIEEAQAEQG